MVLYMLTLHKQDKRQENVIKSGLGNDTFVPHICADGGKGALKQI